MTASTSHQYAQEIGDGRTPQAPRLPRAAHEGSRGAPGRKLAPLLRHIVSPLAVDAIPFDHEEQGESFDGLLRGHVTDAKGRATEGRKSRVHTQGGVRPREVNRQ